MSLGKIQGQAQKGKRCRICAIYAVMHNAPFANTFSFRPNPYVTFTPDITMIGLPPSDIS